LADISTVDQAAKAMRDEEMLAEIEDFLEDFNQPTYRAMRINGVRVATWVIARWAVWGQHARMGAIGSRPPPVTYYPSRFPSPTPNMLSLGIGEG
jgi:hypothetical protein